jgi:hypothetical protein
MTTGKNSEKNPKESDYEAVKKLSFIREGLKKAKKKKKSK